MMTAQDVINSSYPFILGALLGFAMIDRRSKVIRDCADWLSKQTLSGGTLEMLAEKMRREVK